MINKLLSSFIRLWNARDELRLRNIRISHLQYFLSFPIGLTLADLQSSFFQTDVTIFGIDYYALVYSAYIAGAIIALLMKSSKLSICARTSSGIAALGLVLWFVMPAGHMKLLSTMLCWFGLGGCLVTAFFAYVFISNNAEKLIGSISIAFFSGFFILQHELGLGSELFTQVVTVVLLIALVTCLFFYRAVDFPNDTAKQKSKTPKGVYIALAYFTAYFVLDSCLITLQNTGIAGGHLFFGIGMLAVILISVTVQLVFRRSVWHMWNIYLITALMAGILMSLASTPTLFWTGAFLRGLSGVGYIASFYTFGGIIKKVGSVTVYKRTLLLALVATGIATVCFGLIQSIFPNAFPWIVVGFTATVFIGFILLSPITYRDLFSADWMDDFRKLDMTEAEQKVEQVDKFENLGLSPREKEVAAFLLQGLTMRQISSEIGISQNTVNGYCGTLYKKLGINSRTELFARFGVRDESRDEVKA